MNASLISVAFYLVIANIAAIIPTQDNHWRCAYVLIVIGVPLLIWAIMQNGWIIGLLIFIAITSILRWPVYYGLKYCKKFFIDKKGN